MTDNLSIVEDSEYEHEQFGRVRLVEYQEDVQRVLLEQADEETYVSGMGHIPSGVSQSLDEFVEHAEPADISISPPVVEIDSETPEIQ